MPWKRMGEWRYRSTDLDFNTRLRWVVSFTSLSLYSRGKSTLVSTGQEIGWVLQSVWPLWKRKILHSREWNPGRPARSPSLYWLSYPDSLLKWYSFNRCNDYWKSRNGCLKTQLSWALPRLFLWGGGIVFPMVQSVFRDSQFYKGDIRKMCLHTYV
jgi:hypothetical protein